MGYLNGQADVGDVEGQPMTGTHELIGFLYAYDEFELRSEDAPLSFAGRVIFGANNSGVGGGVEGRARIGDELGMNFVTGVTLISQIGYDAFMQFNVRPGDRSFVALTAELQNYPVASNTAFLSSVTVRYVTGPNVSILVRAGFAARSIHRVGGDGGLGVLVGF